MRTPGGIQNRLLATLRSGEYERLLSNMESIRFPRNRILYEAGDRMSHAYFLNSGIASLLATTDNGETIDISMIGYEGFIGIPILLDNPRACLITFHMPCDAPRNRIWRLAR